MRKMFLPVVLILVLLSLVLSACASSATPAPADTQAPAEGGAPAADEKVTLRVLVHQNPPMVEYMEAFNQKFQEKYPNVTVDMSVVNANDLSTVTQTRLTANDVDVVDLFGFANAARPYMKNVDPPNWQTLIEHLQGWLVVVRGHHFMGNCVRHHVCDGRQRRRCENRR